MASLAVFLNDALATFHAKGEVKPRYYNPGGLFSEVHFFTPARRDIDPALVQDVVGHAKLVIHAMGPGYALAGLRGGSPLGVLLRRVRSLTSQLPPHVLYPLCCLASSRGLARSRTRLLWAAGLALADHAPFRHTVRWPC